MAQSLPIAAYSLVRGEWRNGQLGPRVEYAYDGTLVAMVEEARAADVDEAVRAAAEAQRQWRQVPAFQRSALLSGIMREIERRADVLVSALVLNSSKTLR